MVERRSPKPEAVGSISPLLPDKINYEKSIKIFTRGETRSFRISWPTKKDTLTGALMVFGLASIAAIFFTLRSDFKIFTKYNIEY